MRSWFNSRRFLERLLSGEGSLKPHPDEECNICVFDCKHPLKIKEVKYNKIKPRDPHTTFMASVTVHDINRYDIIDDIYKLYDLRNLPVVYCFYSIDNIPMYVGQSKNFWKRLKKHIRGNDETTGPDELYKYFRYVQIFQLDSWDTPHRMLLEQMIIAREKPAYNLYSIGYVEREIYEQVLIDHKDNKRDAWNKEVQDKIKIYYEEDSEVFKQLKKVKGQKWNDSLREYSKRYKKEKRNQK
jgi:hypothetical protein